MLKFQYRLKHRKGNEDLRRIFRNPGFEGREVCDIFIIQPLHFKVQIHIVCTLAQAMLVMFWTGKGEGKREREKASEEWKAKEDLFLGVSAKYMVVCCDLALDFYIYIKSYLLYASWIEWIEFDKTKEHY